MSSTERITAEQLNELYNENGLTQKEIAERFNVTQSYISRQMNDHGITTRHPNPWSETETTVLQKHYNELSRKEIERRLPDRSWNAIKLKAIEMGLARSAEEYRNSDEVAEKLRSLAEENTIAVDFEAVETLSYILGVVDGDGFHNNTTTVGLEVTSTAFADKFYASLESVGLNPGRRRMQGKETIWASSSQLINWMMDMDCAAKHSWLMEDGDSWHYIEGSYESDGNIHPSGSPRICSYDEDEKIFLHNLLSELGIECTIQQNNVWISKSSADKFFENIAPVIRQQP